MKENTVVLLFSFFSVLCASPADIVRFTASTLRLVKGVASFVREVFKTKQYLRHIELDCNEPKHNWCKLVSLQVYCLTITIFLRGSVICTFAKWKKYLLY